MNEAAFRDHIRRLKEAVRKKVETLLTCEQVALILYNRNLKKGNHER
jgi:hypothetical protein